MANCAPNAIGNTPPNTPETDPGSTPADALSGTLAALARLWPRIGDDDRALIVSMAERFAAGAGSAPRSTPAPGITPQPTDDRSS